MPQRLRLNAENLACERGGRLVFSNVNFTLNAGELMELRGANGSGKSSLLRLLAGLNTPAEGKVHFENSFADSTLAEQAHYIGHAEANKPALSVIENLKFWAKFFGTEMSDHSLTAFNLEALANDQALLLSAGQRRRLSLTRLVIAQLPVWLLDEPTVGLDAASLNNLQTLIKKHLDNGGMVIAATHTELGVKTSHKLHMNKTP
jgi:heme exporter protein A